MVQFIKRLVIFLFGKPATTILEINMLDLGVKRERAFKSLFFMDQETIRSMVRLLEYEIAFQSFRIAESVKLTPLDIAQARGQLSSAIAFKQMLDDTGDAKLRKAIMDEGKEKEKTKKVLRMPVNAGSI